MAERVLVNGNALTMDPARPHAEAVVVSDDRIAFVGSTTEARTVAGVGARETDLGGQTVVPGFNEAHNHMLGFGLALAQIDAGYPAIGSIADLGRGVAGRAATAPAGRWVRGRGYDDNKLA
ncbi:MAG TPA: amidohydrolase family protein, partial [Thermomicrobiales bacterium]|nr:amidohydrolase family protein [Thermomicrobiales bacterium]